MLAQVTAFLILANGCQPSLGACGYVGSYLEVNDVTTQKPSRTRTSDTPKLVTYTKTEVGKVIRKNYVMAAKKERREEPPNYGAPKDCTGKCGTGTR